MMETKNNLTTNFYFPYDIFKDFAIRYGQTWRLFHIYPSYYLWINCQKQINWKLSKKYYSPIQPRAKSYVFSTDLNMYYIMFMYTYFLTVV